MIPDLKDDRLVSDLCRGYLEVDGVVVGWIGSALHLVACLHLLTKVVIKEPWLSTITTYIESAWQQHSADIAVRCPSKQVRLGQILVGHGVRNQK